MPPLRRHATLVLTLLTLGTPSAALGQGLQDIPPVTTTPQVEPDPEPSDPEPSEPEPEPTEPDPRREPEPAREPEAEPAGEPDGASGLADTGADADAIALLGGAVLLVGFGLRLRSVPDRV